MRESYRLVLWLALYAMAMANVEATLVIYLRRRFVKNHGKTCKLSLETNLNLMILQWS